LSVVDAQCPALEVTVDLLLAAQRHEDLRNGLSGHETQMVP
jgi:hypothetical protein